VLAAGLPLAYLRVAAAGRGEVLRMPGEPVADDAAGSGTRPLIPFGGSLCGQACHPKLGRSLFDTFHFSDAFGVAAHRAAQGLDRDELYVNLGCLGECAQVAGI
jgi:hypothetical protein